MENLLLENRPVFTGGRPATMVDALLGKVEAGGGRPVFTYLPNGDDETLTHTFADLDRQARALAALLRQCQCRPGDRALLLYPPGTAEFVTAFVGCLYAGVIAIPVPPPHPARVPKQGPPAGGANAAASAARVQRTLAKILAIVSDARPAVILTTHALRSSFESASAEFEPMRAARWVTTEGLGDELAAGWERPPLGPDTLAFLQYTSGSTAAPKGVMVSHANLLYNAHQMEHSFGHTPDDVMVTWLPTFHDMGLIEGILQSLYTGFRCYVMPPAAFIQRPLRWLRALSRYGGTHTAAPNFAYDLCVRKATPEECAGLDLSRWRVAVNGAEPVRKETLDQFTQTFAPYGFRAETHYPSYGLAESTLFVSGWHDPSESYVSFDLSASALERHRAVEVGPGGAGAEARGDVRTLVGCGSPQLEMKVLIVNPETQEPSAPGEVGEIWLSSPSVAEGYWELPELSERTFRARPADGTPGTYLRTGDLGFVAAGRLVITGRHKDLIIVAGANHYPQDIELTAERSHPGLRPGCVAAFPVEIDGEERVAVAAEVRLQQSSSSSSRGENASAAASSSASAPSASSASSASPAAKELVSAVRRAIAEDHEIQVHNVVLLKAGTIPKTSSGKIQRRACRDLFLTNRFDLWEG